MNSKNILFLALFCLSCPVLPLWSMQEIQDPFDIKKIPGVEDIRKLNPTNIEDNIKQGIDSVSMLGVLEVNNPSFNKEANEIGLSMANNYGISVAFYKLIYMSATIDDLLYYFYLDKSELTNKAKLQIDFDKTALFDNITKFFDRYKDVDNIDVLKQILLVEAYENFISPVDDAAKKIDEKLQKLRSSSAFLMKRIRFLALLLPRAVQHQRDVFLELSEDENFEGKGEQLIIQGWLKALQLTLQYMTYISDQLLKRLFLKVEFDDKEFIHLLQSSVTHIAFNTDADQEKINRISKDNKDILMALALESRTILQNVKVFRRFYIERYLLLHQYDRLKTVVLLSFLTGSMSYLIYRLLPTSLLKTDGKSVLWSVFEKIIGKTHIRPLPRR